MNACLFQRSPGDEDEVDRYGRRVCAREAHFMGGGSRRGHGSFTGMFEEHPMFAHGLMH